MFFACRSRFTFDFNKYVSKSAKLIPISAMTTAMARPSFIVRVGGFKGLRSGSGATMMDNTVLWAVDSDGGVLPV